VIPGLHPRSHMQTCLAIRDLPHGHTHEHMRLQHINGASFKQLWALLSEVALIINVFPRPQHIRADDTTWLQRQG
jgi:hypothetical protein